MRPLMRQGWLFSAALLWLAAPTGAAGALPSVQGLSAGQAPFITVQFRCGQGKTRDECAAELLQRRADELKEHGRLLDGKTPPAPQAKPAAPAPQMEKSPKRPVLPAVNGRAAGDRDGREVRREDRSQSRDRDRSRNERDMRNRGGQDARDREVWRPDRERPGEHGSWSGNRGSPAARDGRRPEDRRGGVEHRVSPDSGQASQRSKQRGPARDRASSARDHDRPSAHDRRDGRKDRNRRWEED